MPFYVVFSCQKFESAGVCCGFILFRKFFQLNFVGLCLLENLRSFHPLFTGSFVFSNRIFFLMSFQDAK